MIKILSEEDKIDICKLYETLDIISIGKKYNISEKRIKNILKSNNIFIKNPHLKTISTDDYIEQDFLFIKAINI